MRNSKPQYVIGDHYVICDICGQKYYRSECKKNYKNQMVCINSCFELRHPQDRPVKVRADQQRVIDARPRPTESYLSYGDVTAGNLAG